MFGTVVTSDACNDGKAVGVCSMVLPLIREDPGMAKELIAGLAEGLPSCSLDTNFLLDPLLSLCISSFQCIICCYRIWVSSASES